MKGTKTRKLLLNVSVLSLLVPVVLVLGNFDSCSVPGGKAEPAVPVTHDLSYYQSADEYPIKFPFPHAGSFRNNGIKPDVHTQAEMNARCQRAFEDWVRYWVTETDCPAGAARHHLGPGPGLPSYAEPYCSWSEFIGWGMLDCVMMDNERNRTKKLFGMLDNFRKAWTNRYGLMASTVKFSGPMDSYNWDSAAEADENIAMALLLAHYQWGSGGETDYLAEARALLAAISVHLVERGSRTVLKPAVTWGGKDLVDPCYYDSIYYPLWFKLTGDAAWTALDGHYRFLTAYFCDTYRTGLLPDWCTAEGRDPRREGKPYLYSWDAQQVPTKWAIHYAWYGRTKGDVFFNAAKMFAAWETAEANGDWNRLVDTYALDGTPVGQVHTGPNGLAGIVDEGYRELVNAGYRHLLGIDPSAYYSWGSALGKVSQLLIYSGNYVNFTDLDQ